MTLTKTLYEVSVIANQARNVACGAVGVVVKDFKPLKDQVFRDESSAMWTEAVIVSEKARQISKRKSYNSSNGSNGTKNPASTAPGSTRQLHTMSRSRFYSSAATTEQESATAAGANTATTKMRANPKKKVKRIGNKLKPKLELSQSEVPSSRLSRMFHYGTLAAGIGLGAAQHGLKKVASGDSGSLSMRSMILSPQNIERMAKKFSQMRGAALKVGQMLSFQDSQILPPEIQQILLRVQNSAHYMPQNQLEQIMNAELGNEWRSRLFAQFDDVPIAAASIGQVHTAVTEDLTPVVVKVQYPGVADSIDSDLNNLLLLLTASSLLPKGLFLDKTIANARVELKWECDYIREAQSLIRFKEMVADDPCFVVPKVYNSLSGSHVLTMERMRGIEIAKGDWDQDTKDWIATQIMRLCLTELGKFKFMQTDPNWANFLYNEETKKIELLDFGAARDFGDEFLEKYIEILRASVRRDREGIVKYSKELGYLTGLESNAMKNAHVDSVLVLGEAFSPEHNNGSAFHFKDQTITERVKGNIGLMLNERLTPPPEETYSLHRKLSGVFLLCARLNATVPCSKLFDEIIGFK